MLKGGLINPDGSRLRFVMEDVIGMGTFGIVLRRGENALKVAKIRSSSGFSEEETAILESDNESNLACLEIEKDVYRRAAPFPGIAECIEVFNEGILMACYDPYLCPHFRYERPPINELPDPAPLLFGKLIQIVGPGRMVICNNFKTTLRDIA
ncbi:MAG: hypothetical protein Q9205_007074, partial [Flavoplaca limonia]